MNVERAIETRRSCREFAQGKVRWDKVLEAVDAALKAPFAGNINNLKFIIVEDEKTKNDIAYQCQQDWVADANIIVVVCSDESQLTRSYHERGKKYSAQQAGAAIQNFTLRLTELGLATCWVGAYADELLKQVLHIPEHISIEAVLPVGKPFDKPPAAKRLSLENATFWGEWGKNHRGPIVKEPSEF